VVKNINQLEELYNINYKAPFELSSLIKSNKNLICQFPQQRWNILIDQN
jgi:hypothetical protein